MAGLRRGDIHAARFGRPHGRVQAGSRPAVILQSNGMAKWSTVLVAPLSTSAHGASFRPTVLLRGTESHVLIDQLRPLDIEHIGKRLGTLTADDLIEVESAVRRVLGLR